MARANGLGVVALVFGFAAFASASVIAAPGESWPVKKKLVGENGGKSKDVSGIACAAPQRSPAPVLSSMTTCETRSSSR